MYILLFIVKEVYLGRRRRRWSCHKKRTARKYVDSVLRCVFDDESWCK